jgi:hypothetical protein
MGGGGRAAGGVHLLPSLAGWGLVVKRFTAVFEGWKIPSWIGTARGPFRIEVYADGQRWRVRRFIARVGWSPLPVMVGIGASWGTAKEAQDAVAAMFEKQTEGWEEK